MIFPGFLFHLVASDMSDKLLDMALANSNGSFTGEILFNFAQLITKDIA